QSAPARRLRPAGRRAALCAAVAALAALRARWRPAALPSGPAGRDGRAGEPAGGGIRRAGPPRAGRLDAPEWRAGGAAGLARDVQRGPAAAMLPPAAGA